MTNHIFQNAIGISLMLFLKPFFFFFREGTFCFWKQKPKNYKETRLFAHEYCSNISSCRTKILTTFRRITFFVVFQNSYVFIPLFLAEPLTMFCGTIRSLGTLYDKHWHNDYTKNWKKKKGDSCHVCGFYVAQPRRPGDLGPTSWHSSACLRIFVKCEMRRSQLPRFYTTRWWINVIGWQW